MITVVSGLPRSGTSLMMQMLEAAGMALLVDEAREADIDNPRGYYELDKVKRLSKDSSWMGDAEGKALKAVSSLLYHLPSDRQYKVIFMVRDMDQVLASQRTMLEHRGEAEGQPNDEAMRSHFQAHLDKLEAWLREQDNMQVMHCSYNALLSDPAAGAHEVAAFLDCGLEVERMAAVVDPSLCRAGKDGKGQQSS
jgi:hypothetical protein